MVHAFLFGIILLKMLACVFVNINHRKSFWLVNWKSKKKKKAFQKNVKSKSTIELKHFLESLSLFRRALFTIFPLISTRSQIPQHFAIISEKVLPCYMHLLLIRALSQNAALIKNPTMIPWYNCNLIKMFMKQKIMKQWY